MVGCRRLLRLNNIREKRGGPLKNYLKTAHLIEEKSFIDDIPMIRFNLKENKGKVPTIILYHGWSSNKEAQRLRGFILANLGFQVIIPDAIHHGERNMLDNFDEEQTVQYFWPTIMKNMEEVNKIMDYSIEHYNADADRFGVTGHSMGGFTAAGVFTHNKHIKTVVVLNGSFNWHGANEIFKKYLGLEGDTTNPLDPMMNQELLIDRPILLLHGASDSVVNIESQRVFYKKIKELYNNESLIQLIEYENLGHFVTTNMMDDAGRWFKKYL